MNQEKFPLIKVSPEMTATCLTAIEVWGQPDQLVQSMGECGEFVEVFGRYIATVGRHFQGRDPDLDDVVEEAADVVILMLQVRELVGGERFDSVLKRKFDKFSTKVYEAKSQSVPPPQPRSLKSEASNG